MTMPTSLCPNRMQVHSVRQETPDVWTINLINHDFYQYHAGQYALVSIRNSDETLRAYTLSSTPGLSPFLSLTVRRLDDGQGSGWLTGEVKPGDYLWLSDAQGEFTCDTRPAERYLMLAAGCGVTPVMSMTRWILHRQPESQVTVIFNVRDKQQVIFAQEWQQLLSAFPARLRLILMVENSDEADELLSGRLSEEKLKSLIPDIAQHTVMTCGPAPYMKNVQTFCQALNVDPGCFFMERFGPEPEAEAGEQMVTMTIQSPLRQVKVPVGMTLLAAMEANSVPVMAACRAGVCGSCKTRVRSGEYTTTSTMTLTPEEIEQGYVLACSCQIQGNVELA
ncbi:NADH oxidoreductase [Morganella morganii]|uniref:NADH oxidoreductase n=1 Tax=Morganella morganii TaxID=582 RepID=UPI00062C68BD|nr:NADH oxidoreductase [Morganella morganii]BEP20281.1 NADH oxidoreductase [Morganella morganii subsp. sibonii]HDS6842897.1 NADH oxidoreductase [Morganella morganii subsp. morganii]EJD6037557.1 NADH oxidoreductase [Morganella morganii]KKY65115.1 HCP oxidoreductase [Morganella morganii]SPX91728.1 NADH oxidoreductase hcr [Morganella morganii]